MVIRRPYSITVLLICTVVYFTASDDNVEVKCEDLLEGQYHCDEPEIDPKTQSARGCTKNHTVEVECSLTLGLKCKYAGNEVTAFMKNVPCRFTNGHSYKTALLLSVFLGMFGIDRFYLGYPAIGLLKFCTLGFFFLFQLIDILLIATQVIGPADQSEYVIDYYGPRLIKVVSNNYTFLKPH